MKDKENLPNNCVICNSDKFISRPYINLYYPHLKYFECDIFSDISINTCQSCGFSQISPYIEKDKLMRFYNVDYHSKFGCHYMSENKIKEFIPSPSYCSLAQFLLFADYGNLKSIKNFLDVGAGVGHSFYTLKTLGYYPQMYALDKSETAINILSKNQVNVIKDFDHVCSLPVKYDSFFDLILSSGSLEHFNPCDIQSALSNIYKVLCNGGCFVCEVPHDDFRKRTNRQHAPHISFFSIESLKKKLTDIGFEVVFISSCGRNIINSNTNETKSKKALVNNMTGRRTIVDKLYLRRFDQLKYKYKMIDRLNDYRTKFLKSMNKNKYHFKMLFKDEIIKENELASSAFEFNYGENKNKLRAVCRK